jgi:hypothetical protein
VAGALVQHRDGPVGLLDHAHLELGQRHEHHRQRVLARLAVQAEAPDRDRVEHRAEGEVDVDRTRAVVADAAGARARVEQPDAVVGAVDRQVPLPLGDGAGDRESGDSAVLAHHEPVGGGEAACRPDPDHPAEGPEAPVAGEHARALEPVAVLGLPRQHRRHRDHRSPAQRRS